MKLTRRDLGKLAPAAIPGLASGRSGTASQRCKRSARGHEAQLEGRRRADRPERAVQLRRPRHECRRTARPMREAEHQRRRDAVAAGRKLSGLARPPTARSRRPRRCGSGAHRLRWIASAAFRKKYEDAGVLIEIVKYDGIYNMADDEVDYCFNLARTLGARAISCEIDAKHTQRIGQFADKHKLMVGYHGHAATTPAHWEAAFAQARYNGANLDLGHFVAGNNTSPVPFLKQHHARITHVHVKDRKTEGRAEHAVRRGGHAHHGGPAADSRQQVADPGDDRIRVSGARRDRIAWPSSQRCIEYCRKRCCRKS